ncbi:MAG: hypothetical protein V7742_12930 [Halioglobus sp.]
MTDEQAKQGLNLPSPGSPSHLDEKVLQYAREQAPTRRSYLQPVWLRSMAAASVVVVAVLLVYPQQLDQVTPPIEIEEIVVRESALLDDGPAAARAPERDGNYMAQQAMMSKASQADDSSSELRMRAAASPQPKLKRELAATSADSQVLAEKEVAPEMLIADAVPTPLDEETIRDILTEIEGLLSAGKTEQVEKAWLALKNRCPGCELPETLEEAITLYLPDIEQ